MYFDVRASRKETPYEILAFGRRKEPAVLNLHSERYHFLAFELCLKVIIPTRKIVFTILRPVVLAPIGFVPFHAEPNTC